MLLFALVGATEMTAQNAVYTLTPGERVTEITAGQQYMIYNSCKSGEGYCFFLYNNGNAFAGLKSTNPSAFSLRGTEAEINKYIFEAETGSVEGTFAMKNLASNTYPKGTTAQSASAVNLHFEEWTATTRTKAGVDSYNHDGTSTANASITADNKVWLIYEEGVNNNWSSQGSNAPSLWESGQPFAIYTVIKEAALEVDITFTDTKTGNTFTLADQIVAVGANVRDAVGTHAFYTINGITDQGGNSIETIAETTTALNVSVTSNFPFEVMTFTDGAFDNANFYTMLIENGNRDVVYNSDTHIHTKAGIKGFNKESLWAFELVRGTEADFRIYNLSRGAGECIYKDGTGNGAVAMGSTESTSNTKFTLFQNGTGYGFFIPGAPTACLNASQNQNSEGANSSLGIWKDGNSPTNSGSRFFFTSVDVMTAAATFIGGADDNYPASNGYLHACEVVPDKVRPLVTYNINKTYANLINALENISEDLDITNPYDITFAPSKVYQIISYNDQNCKGWTIYSDTWCDANGGNTQYDDRKILIGANRPIGETLVWFETVSNGFRIHHANSDYRFVALSVFGDMQTPDMPVATDAGGTYVITPAKYLSNVFALSNYGVENKWLHCGTGDGNTIVRTQAPEANDGDLWLIKEVSEIPVTIGAAKWSTLCLPVAVTVPNDASLKVYTVSGVDNATGVMTLDEVPAGTVVAKKTGLLLASTSENESDTYNFAVSTEAGTSYASNILMGTTARRTDFNSTSATDPTAITIPHYALAQKDGVVAFYPSTLNILPANKAYIKKADIASIASSASALFMNGETTGVENAFIQNGETEEYYDLNGRRVLYPTTGIYATRSGKKVFIK